MAYYVFRRPWSDYRRRIRRLIIPLAGDNAAAATTLAAPTESAAGTVIDNAAAATNLGTPTQAAAGKVIDNAAASTTLGAPTESAAGTVPPSGDNAVGNHNLDAPTEAATGTVVDSAAAAQIAPAPGEAATGQAIDNASGGSAAPAPTETATGTNGGTPAPVNARGNTTLAAPTSSATGTVHNQRTVYPNTTTRLETPYLTVLKRADPSYFRDRLHEVEYEFSRRTFYADPTDRGAYGEYEPIEADDFFQDATPDVFQEPAAPAASSPSSGSSAGALDFSDPEQSGLYEVVP